MPHVSCHHQPSRLLRVSEGVMTGGIKSHFSDDSMGRRSRSHDELETNRHGASPLCT
jgi:hypothetical protein